MHDLRLVGVHEDGEHLLLAGPDGEQYVLAVDEPLRAAVRRDRAHLGQLQIEMSGDLRPREVQSQIRAGASAEEVAERSGWPLDRVRRYEGAVLAEREHMAELARGVTLRRRGADATPPTLSVRVEQRLAARGVDVHSNVWDAYRADDGPWMLVLRFAAGGREREARWAYDGAARTVTPQDDEALWLSEDEKPPAAPMAAPHLSAVPTVTATPAGAGEALYDVEADGGLDQPETVTLETPSAVDLVGAMRQRRHGRRRQPPPIELPEGPARRHPSGRARGQEPLQLDPLIFDPTLLGDPPAPHPFPFPERLRDPQDEPATSSGDADGEPTPKDLAGDPAPDTAKDTVKDPTKDTAKGTAAKTIGDPPGEPDDRPAEPPRPPRNFAPPRLEPAAHTARTSRAGHADHPDHADHPKGAPTRTAPALAAPDDPVSHRRPRRASVPSWDEIMFGGKRD